MDPDKTLANIQAIMKEMRGPLTESEFAEHADELAWLVQDLDDWLSKGGYLPNDWRQKVSHTRCLLDDGPCFFQHQRSLSRVKTDR